jgi:hypothetical protein
VRALAAVLALLLAAPAMAGILVEGELEGEPVRVELGELRDRALVTLGAERRLVQLVEPPAPPPGFRLAAWSGGPVVAGYGTTYNVLTRDAAICAEVLSAPWMAPFLRPAVAALALLQVSEPRLAPIPRDGCGPLPFTLLAGNGWPLFAGWKDAPLFATTRLSFSHPTPPELRAAAPAR